MNSPSVPNPYMNLYTRQSMLKKYSEYYSPLEPAYVNALYSEPSDILDKSVYVNGVIELQHKRARALME